MTKETYIIGRSYNRIKSLLSGSTMGDCGAGEGEGSSMTQLKHTPAPWSYDEKNGKIKSSRGDIIAHTLDGADAHLLAAAPELLQALEHAKMMVLGGGLPVSVTNNAIAMYDAAIDKAKGDTMPEAYANAQKQILEEWEF